MIERRRDGQTWPAFEAWLRENDPESVAIKEEAVKIIAHLDEVLAEPVRHKTTLEEALVTAMEQEVERAKNESKFWQAKAIEEYENLQAAEREHKRKGVQMLRWAGIFAILEGLAVMWLFWWLH